MGAGAFSGERPWRRVRRVVDGPAPAAGADWSITVPSGRLWRVISIYASLVTAIAVATRDVRLTLADGHGTFLVLPPVATQVASLTVGYAWHEHASPLDVAGQQVIPLPPLVLPAGWAIAVATDALQAADQWGAQQLLVVETIIKGGAVDLGDLPELVVELAPGPMA